VQKYWKFTLPQLLGDLHGKEIEILASIIIPIEWLGTVAAQIGASASILMSFSGNSFTTLSGSINNTLSSNIAKMLWLRQLALLYLLHIQCLTDNYQ